MTVLEAMHAHLLWLAVAWPLLLAVPGIRGVSARVGDLALAPAALLVAWPGDAGFHLPSDVLVEGFAIAGQTRWILAMALTVWLTASHLIVAHDRRAESGRHTLFLLTVAGNLGTVLSTDIIGFFSFSALMGYGFYGLFVRGADEQTRRAAGMYLIFLLLADQALFEAMLSAARVTSDLTFSAVREAMASGTHASTFVSFALAGFLLKAGLWPTQVWLSQGFASAPRTTALLLGGVPVAMALFGAARWLPLGEATIQTGGTALHLFGLTAAAYGAMRLVRTAHDVKRLPAWVIVMLTGLFSAFLGEALSEPAVWQAYQEWVPPFLAALGVISTIVTLAVHFWTARHPYAMGPAAPGPLKGWSARCCGTARRWREGAGLRPLGRTIAFRVLKQARRILALWDTRPSVSDWTTAMILFVLLGLAVAWLAI